MTTVTLTNTQTADVDAYGNLFTPFKYNKFYKENVGNTYHVYVENQDDDKNELIISEDSAETLNNLIGLGGAVAAAILLCYTLFFLLQQARGNNRSDNNPNRRVSNVNVNSDMGILKRYVCADWPECAIFKNIRDALGSRFQYGKRRRGQGHYENRRRERSLDDDNSGEELNSMVTSLLSSHESY